MALKLTLDWANEDQTPDEVMREKGWYDDVTPVTVEYDASPGPSGWPTVTVIVAGNDGAHTGPWMWAWLRDVYGEDGDGASDLADMAVNV